MILQKRQNGLSESIGDSVVYEYVAFDVPENAEGDDTLLRQLLVAELPTYENNIKLSGISVKEQINNTTWLISAEYENKNKGFPNTLSMNFDTGGATAHKTNDLLLLDSGILQNGVFVQNPDLLEEGMPVGFNGEDIEGVDIIIPSYKFTETHPIPDSALTQAVRRKLFELTGTVNNAAWRGFEAGEVLFTGVSGSKNGVEKWILNYNFEALLNKRNFIVGGFNIVLKRGWEYVAVRYTKVLSDDKTRLIVTATQVDVHKMYETKDFAELGIGIQTWDELVQLNPEALEQLLLPFGE